MAFFSKKSGPEENRIENCGRWPVRLTKFYLEEDYEFPPTDIPEVFFVQKGNFLHETDGGAQALHTGGIIRVNPGNRHSIKNPEKVLLIRLRYLPEWFSEEYSLIIHSPDLVALFFDQSWFQYPRDETIHVFTTRKEAARRISEELAYAQDLLSEGRQFEPVTRVSLLRLMMLIADEYKRYWRGVGELDFRPEAKHALDVIERKIRNGDPFYEKKMARGGYEFAAIETAFRNLTGLEMKAYADRRRAFHAAVRLLSTREEPRAISKSTGFSTTSQFSQLFQNTFGISPNVYRERFGPSQLPDAANDGKGTNTQA